MEKGQLEYHSFGVEWGELCFENLYVEYKKTEECGPMEACGWGTGDGRDHYEPAWMEENIHIEIVTDGEGDEISDYDEEEIIKLINETDLKEWKETEK